MDWGLAWEKWGGGGARAEVGAVGGRAKAGGCGAGGGGGCGGGDGMAGARAGDMAGGGGRSGGRGNMSGSGGKEVDGGGEGSGQRQLQRHTNTDDIFSWFLGTHIEPSAYLAVQAEHVQLRSIQRALRERGGVCARRREKDVRNSRAITKARCPPSSHQNNNCFLVAGK